MQVPFESETTIMATIVQLMFVFFNLPNARRAIQTLPSGLIFLLGFHNFVFLSITVFLDEFHCCNVNRVIKVKSKSLQLLAKIFRNR